MNTPLYTALLELKAKNQLSFHMPGHFDGKALPGFDRLTEIDTTEVPESDNLYLPVGPIAEAQRLAADFFGARETRFLVNGSSGGILAMVGAVVGGGGKLICDRYCHRSLISALVLSGAQPVWLWPEPLEGGLLWGGVDPSAVERAIDENPDAKGVFLTSPNYFGLSSDLKKIADIVHSRGLPLLVDAAHGAHYGLSPLLPPSAVSCGADLAVTSAHKTLPALTQSAYLHINGDFPLLDRLLKTYQTSSPSYILMASLDYARALMEDRGRELWTELAKAAAEIFPGRDRLPGSFVKYADPCRLTLPTKASPAQAAQELRLRHGISVECVYGGGVVCILNTAHSRRDLLRLKEALDAADQSLPAGSGAVLAPEPTSAPLTPRQAFFAAGEEVDLSRAAGRVCGAEVVIYPPGVPQLAPGEVITPAAAEAIARAAAAGAEIHGLRDGKITVLR